MKISKKLVKRVLKVAFVVSCTFLLAKQVEANTVYKDLKPNKIRIINGNYAETYGGVLVILSVISSGIKHRHLRFRMEEAEQSII